MFSPTVRSGTSVVSCVTVAIPAAMDATGSPNTQGLPARTTLPSSGVTCPERILSIVDFPEPFSPTRPCTSP
jgi:hypothetical protein